MTNPLDKMVLRKDLKSPFAAQFGVVRIENGGPQGSHHRVHQGWDLEACPGTPVRAVSDGTIIRCSSIGLGLAICLKTELTVSNKHSESYNLHIVYGHLSRSNVRFGERVHEGDIIALTGNSGAVTEPPHLHLELRKGPLQPRGLVDRIDPAQFFANQIVEKTNEGLYMPYRAAAPFRPLEIIKSKAR